MRVVQINSECDRGSTGRIAASISKALTREEIENYILYSGNHHSDFPNGIQITSKLDLRVHQVLSRVFGDQGWHSYFATKRLICRLKRIDPDIIHLHNIHGYYIHLGVLFDHLRKSDAHIVWTLHDCWPFTGHCPHFLLSGCEKWKSECNNCPRIHQYPYSLFLDRSMQLHRRKKELIGGLGDLTIVTPSEWLAQTVRQSFISQRKIVVIRNGIDLDVFKPRRKPAQKADDRFIILGVSSVWSYSKGLDVFCELARELDSTKFKIVLVGTDEKIDALLPDSIISIHRTQNQKKLAELYSMADLFLNPTREDNYPTVNLEAIACGTPVLTFDTGGSPESIVFSDEMTVYSNSIEETIAKIQKLYHAKKDYSTICYQKSREFDEKICVNKYLELYRQIMNGGIE